VSPIRPENRSLYPPDWPEVSRRIKERADWRCQCAGECGSPGHAPCGIEHGALVQSAHVGRDGGRKEYRIVLTAAHLDHDPANCSEENLKALCQLCHNRYDLPARVANRRKRMAKEAGMLALEGMEEA
jgi:hypothetical protein